MQDNNYKLYCFFNNPIVQWVRVLLFLLLGLTIYSVKGTPQTVVILLPVYGFLLIQEGFIFTKLNRMKPPKKIADNNGSIYGCMYFETRSKLENTKSIINSILEISKQNEVKYFLKLINISLSNENAQIGIDELAVTTEELVKKTQGVFVHGVDVVAAYLLLLDKKNKILFNSSITHDDVAVVLAFVKKQLSLDHKKHFSFEFSGSGVFDFFVYGWSAELVRYASDFTRDVLSNKVMTMPVGREREYDLLITALSKNSSSNVLLVGEAGVGKTTLISEFALDSNMAKLPSELSHKVVFKLFPERLLSGVKDVGEIESRLVLLFSELIHAGNVVVYIPNIENIFGGGGENMDISGVLTEYLRSNRVKIIGSITPNNYQTYINPKQELKELFDVVEVEEPDSQTALFMLLEKSKELEFYNRVDITFEGLKETLELSSSYINDGTSLPGRAIRLLEDVISASRTHGRTIIGINEVRQFVEEKTQIVLDEPTEKESVTLLHLEEEIHKRIVSQDDAVVAISDALRRVRSGMKEKDRPIASFLFLGPTGVGKTETAKALALTYFGDENAMIRLDMSEYQTQDSIERFLGSHEKEVYERTVMDDVLEKPFTLILLDEFEKAHPQILDLFLQVFDEGRLTDNRGRVISFKQTIIIATSNAGSEYIREVIKNSVSGEVLKHQLVDKVLQMKIFRPELVNRFDDVVVFKPLEEKDIISVAKLFLNDVVKKMEEQKIIVTYNEEAAMFIAKHSYSAEFGARNVRRFIEQSIENKLSKMILSHQINKDQTVKIVIQNDALEIVV